MKLTKAQIETLNNAEQNSSKAGRVWMPTWNHKTIAILHEAGFIEELDDMNHIQVAEAKALILKSAESIVRMTEENRYMMVQSSARAIQGLTQDILSRSWYITEAGRQALILANGGA